MMKMKMTTTTMMMIRGRVMMLISVAARRPAGSQTGASRAEAGRCYEMAQLGG